MAAERDDERAIGRLLSRHADRRELDLDAFMVRVMAEVSASPRDPESARPVRNRPVRNRPVRRRLLPALVAAVSVLTVLAVGSGVSALARWTIGDDRTAVARSSSSPDPVQSAAQGPAHSPVPQGNVPPSSAVPSHQAPTTTTPSAPATLPTSLRWSSGAPVIWPRTGADGVTGLKDPTVVSYGGRWHVFATSVTSTGYGLVYLSFTRWSEANTAPLHTLASSPMGSGFRASPQVFYFAPQKLWYLVYQTGNASYSTNPDISNPNGWSARKDFYAAVPELIGKNVAGSFWLSMWVICDETDCYLFSSDNRGHLFRSQTSKASFPNGMSQPVIAAQDPGQGTTFAADRVYQIAGTGRYLLLAQAFGGDGHGYLRSWTSPRIAGPWTPLADTPSDPFAGTANITFSGGGWTSAIVHGELLRDGYDQTLSVNPCHLRLLALGLDPRFNDTRSFVIGLLTQTNSTCR